MKHGILTGSQETLTGESLEKTLDMTAGLRLMQYDIHQIAGVNVDLSPWRNPDVRANFEALPFREGMFEKVLYDPPHTVDRRNTLWATTEPINGLGPLFAGFPYGAYPSMKELRRSIEEGLKEACRVLEEGGFLIFKWSDSEKSWSWAVDLIAKVAPQLKLYYLRHLRTATGTKNFTFYATYRKKSIG